MRRDPDRTPGEVLLRATRLLARGIPFYLLDMLSDTVAQATAALANGPAQVRWWVGLGRKRR